MKLFILLLSIFCQLTIGYSQITTTGFKNVQRQTADTIKKSFTPIVINGNITTKSAGLNLQGNSYLETIALPDTNTKVEYSKTSALPIFIEKQSNTKAAYLSNEARSFGFLESIKGYTKIDRPAESFFITYEKDDKQGQTHVRMSQKFKGIEVYGSDFYVHLKKGKEQFTGSYHLIINQVDTVARISETRAIEIVTSDLQTKTTVTNLSAEQKKILKYDQPEIKLVFKNLESKTDSFRLLYQIAIRPNFMQEWIYFIDAIDGTIHKGYNNTKFNGPATATAYDLSGVLRTINTYFQDGKYYMSNQSEPMYNAIKDEGYIQIFDYQNTSNNWIAVTSPNNTWNNKAAVSANYFSTLTYRYFKNTFNRNSINGDGGNMLTFVNYVSGDILELGNTAFWNGKFAVFGTGGTKFSNLAGGLDAIAHEYGHGIIGSTADLIYENQSGAINETYADIFGAMVDRADWYIGEDITKVDYSPTSRLRDMSNPHNSGVVGDQYWQPMHTSEMYIGTEDYGGVHANSGIGNYAYYLFATAITKEKAEQVFYKALTDYLVSSSQFIDLRIAVIQAATDLYGATSMEVNKAKEAFDAVGIYEDSEINYSIVYPTNPGTLNLCYYDLDLTHSYTFYTSSIMGLNPVGLTKNLSKSRLSFTDNGTVGVYVSSNGTIRGISMSNKNDYEIQTQPIWSNVAISKDGMRLAAVTTVADTAIWVYDYNSSKWAKFRLYNPTTSSDNLKSSGVMYSDAIEFDITGENIIYDAFNKIKSSTGSDIDYWDIGFINVWDNQTNKFGTGNIIKLVGSLPAKVSIGNPTFSKNSPQIIAFDFLDESTNKFSILGMNLLTGDGGIIASNTIIGYPSYSKDDKALVYSSATGAIENVKGINLLSNKISPDGSAVQLINKAKWGVCYATGTRVLGLAPVSNFSSSYRKGKTPLSIQFFDNSINKPASWLWTFEGGTPSTSTLQNPIVTYTTAGIYKVTLKATNQFGNNTVVKSNYIEVIQSVLSVSPNALTITATANSTKTFDISSNNGWTAFSSQTWLTLDNSSGPGNATVTLIATANPTTSTRSATVTVSGTGVTAKTITVTQAGATPVLNVSSISVSIAATANSTNTFDITSNISWTVVSNQTWITLNAASGTGNSPITLTSAVNPTTSTRSATVTVSGTGVTSKTITVTQAGATPVLNVSSNSVSIAAPFNSTKTVDITSNSNWTVVSNQTWLTLNAASGSDNSTITLTATVNPRTSTRSATVTVSGTGVTAKTITVTQEGSLPVLNVSASSLTIAAPANSTKTVDITSNSDWTVVSNETWLTLNAANGSDNSTITLTAAVNPTTSTRSATVTVSETGVTAKTITVTQEGSLPVLNVSSSSLTIAAPANSTKTVDITSNSDWSVVSNQTWLTLNAASGSGNTTITLTAAVNPTSSTRSATVTVSGTGVTSQTITVTQEGGTTGISDITVNDNIIYPNPTNGILYFNTKVDKAVISIFDLNGKKILEVLVSSNQIDVSTLSNGIYMIKIEDNSGLIIGKFVKN